MRAGRDASCQSLQPTCCHEYQGEHAIPERWAFALLAATCAPCLRLAGNPAFGIGLLLTVLVGHCWRSQPRVDSALVRAASCYRSATPQGRSVSRTRLVWALSARHEPGNPTRRRPVSPSAASPGIPGSIAKARTCFSRCPTRAPVRQIRDAFHRQVPPPPAELTPDRWPHGPPLVPQFCHWGPRVRHAFTLPPKER
jgi:hypothetical protein